MCDIEPDVVREVAAENDTLRQENSDLKAEVERLKPYAEKCDGCGDFEAACNDWKHKCETAEAEVARLRKVVEAAINNAECQAIFLSATFDKLRWDGDQLEAATMLVEEANALRELEKEEQMKCKGCKWFCYADDDICYIHGITTEEEDDACQQFEEKESK